MAFDFSILRNPWVLGGIVVGGAVLAFVVIPKLRGGSLGATGASASAPSGDSAASGSAAGDGTGTPTITYEIEQQQYTPVGASAGTAIAPTPASLVAPSPSPTTAPAPMPASPPTPAPVRSQTPPVRPKQFVRPSAWPNRQSTLRGISQAHGVALSAIESFPENQYIRSRGRGWNSTIYTTDAIRIG